jgi:hypothetical protein
VPKKDSMGMDYIPVHAGEADDSGTVTVSLSKVQRSGVRTETVSKLALAREVRGVGTVEHDESTLSIVTVRSDGYIEELLFSWRRSTFWFPCALRDAQAPIATRRAPSRNCEISTCRSSGSTR